MIRKLIKPMLVIGAAGVALAGASAAFARARMAKSIKHAFAIEAPDGWEIGRRDEDHDPIKMTIEPPDKSANLTIMAIPAGKESAAALLASVDKRRKAASELPVAKAKLTQSRLTRLGADDAALGAYTLGGRAPGYPVVQRAIAVVKGGRALLVIGAYQKAKEKQWSKTIDASLSTFKLTD